MSFYVNNNNPNRPGPIYGNPTNGICEKILIETTKVFDACLSQTTETGVISFNINGIHPHDASTIFDERDICLRAGHHCAQLIIKWLDTIGTLRACFYVYNDFEDCDKFIEAVKDSAEYFKEW
jgi:selenocysteine lyase/cysteine desulfurase